MSSIPIETEAPRKSRHLWWFVLVGVAAAAVVAWAFLSGSRPYGFLGGFKEVEFKVNVRDRKQFEEMQLDFAVFTAQADFAQLVKEADKELLSRGFIKESGRGGGEVMYMLGAFDPFKSKPSDPFPDIVIIKKDLKGFDGIPLENLDGGGELRETKGWITVGVGRQRPDSIFKRFQAWLGL